MSDKQFLLEEILRKRIYNSLYWKEKCYALNAETITERAYELKYIGGSFSSLGKVTPFICLLLKLLQIEPHKEIINEYLKSGNNKYLIALSAFYCRLSFNNSDVFRCLNDLLNDYRKLRIKDLNGTYSVITMDEYIYNLLNSDECLGVTLPKILKKSYLVKAINKNNITFLKHIKLHEKDINQQLNIINIMRFNDYNLQYEESDEEIEIKEFSIDDIGKTASNQLNTTSVEYWNGIRKKLGLSLLQ